MFGKYHTLKQLSVSAAVAALLAVVAVPSALGAHDSWYGYAVSETANQQSIPFTTDTLGGNGKPEQAGSQGYRFTTDTLGGNGKPEQAASPGYRFTTDTLGGNGHPTLQRGYDPQAYVYGGASPAVAKAIQAVGQGKTSAPAVVFSSPNGASFNWGDAAVGAGIAFGLMLLLLGGAMLRTGKRGVLTA